jgi:hypothetical protein
MYMPTESSAEMYVPDTITVLYPLLVDGQTVYDEGGTKSGINVAVNIRHKAVGGVWSLTSQNYMSSGYDAVQDEQQILSYIDAFEQYATDYLPPEMKIEKKELELGTPAQGYVNMYRMLDQHSEQLLVPALIFPVLNAPEDQPWFRKNVIVPLAADLLARQDMGRPMPLDAVR